MKNAKWAMMAAAMALAAGAMAGAMDGQRGTRDMHLRNDGVWEAVYRVDKERECYEFSGFRGYMQVEDAATGTNYEAEVRFGVPQTITADLPYTDLLEYLPADWPATKIRVRTGFDGYLLIRYDERENQLTIKRLLPEKLPWERRPRNIRVSREDLLYGV